MTIICISITMTSMWLQSSSWIPDDHRHHHNQQVTTIITMTNRWLLTSPWLPDDHHHHYDNRWLSSSLWIPDDNCHHHNQQVVTIITMVTWCRPTSPWPPVGDHHHHDLQLATIITMTTSWHPSSPWPPGESSGHKSHLQQLLVGHGGQPQVVGVVRPGGVQLHTDLPVAQHHQQHRWKCLLHSTLVAALPGLQYGCWFTGWVCGTDGMHCLL